MNKFKLVVVICIVVSIVFAAGYMMISYRSAETKLLENYYSLEKQYNNKNSNDKNIKFLQERDAETGLLTFSNQGSYNENMDIAKSNSDSGFTSDGDETSVTVESDLVSDTPVVDDSNINQNNGSTGIYNDSSINGTSSVTQSSPSDNPSGTTSDAPSDTGTPGASNEQDTSNTSNGTQQNVPAPTTSATDVKSLASTLAQNYVSKLGNKPYSQTTKIDITINGKTFTGRPDCSGSISAMLYLLGKTSSYISKRSDDYHSSGFEGATNITGSVTNWGELQPGDVVAKNGHVDMVVESNGTGAYIAGFGGDSQILQIAEYGHQQNMRSGAIGSQYTVWRK